MNSKILGLLAVGLMAGPISAKAVTTAHLGPCPGVASQTCFVSVTGLDVNGVLYDAFFVEGTYANVLAGNPGVALFNGNQAGALSAANAITTAFRAVGFYDTDSALSPNGGWAGADIAFSGGAGSYLVWSNLNFAPSPVVRAGGLANWFVFSPSASVPEPGTLALLGLGLAGLGLSRRRKAN